MILREVQSSDIGVRKAIIQSCRLAFFMAVEWQGVNIEDRTS